MNEYEILVKLYKPPDMGKLLFLQLNALGELMNEVKAESDPLQEAVNEAYREIEKRNPLRLWIR